MLRYFWFTCSRFYYGLGVIRDVLLNKIPLILRKEVYATACLFGALLFLVLDYFEVQDQVNELICFSVIVVTRFLAIKFNISFPSIGKIKKS